MTTTTPEKATPTPVVGPPARQRSSKRILAAALVVLLGAGLVAAAFLTVTSAGTVVVARQSIERGQTITGDQLTTVDGNVDVLGAAVVAGPDLDSLIGQTAAQAIPEGSIINPALVTPEAIPGPGEAVVGLALEPGEIPFEELAPGDPIRIVSVAGPNADPDTSSPDAIDAIVHKADYEDPTLTLLDVIVPQDQEGLAASRASTGKVAVVRGSVTP